MAEKACIKLSLNVDDKDEEQQQLTSLYFTQNEDERYQSKRSLRANIDRSLRSNADDSVVQADLSTQMTYELDSDAFGNPNYDGYYCSINNFDDQEEPADHDTPRMTTLSLPKLESDEIDGTISTQLDVELHWVDEDGESYVYSSCNWNKECVFIQPTRCGAAKLSIEQFQSETIAEEQVTKVLRQTWEQRDDENRVVYSFTFVVPFKKIDVGISWGIDEGDQLDLTQCKFDVNVRYDPPGEETLPETVAPSEMGTSAKYESDAAIPLNSSLLNNNEDTTTNGEEELNKDNSCISIDDANTLDDHSMPNAVYVRTVSVDDTNL